MYERRQTQQKNTEQYREHEIQLATKIVKAEFKICGKCSTGKFKIKRAFRLILVQISLTWPPEKFLCNL